MAQLSFSECHRLPISACGAFHDFSRNLKLPAEPEIRPFGHSISFGAGLPFFAGKSACWEQFEQVLWQVLGLPSASLFELGRVQVGGAGHKWKLPADGERRDRREVAQDRFDGKSIVGLVLGKNEQAVRIAGEDSAPLIRSMASFPEALPLAKCAPKTIAA